MRRPVRVDNRRTRGLRTLLAHLGMSPAPGYKVYVTNTRRGRCNYGQKTITVPVWAMSRAPEHVQDSEYKIYYAAHECAHSWCFEESGERNHGGTFMDWFKHLCPEHLQHHESGYKPRLAAAAGIASES